MATDKHNNVREPEVYEGCKWVVHYQPYLISSWPVCSVEYPHNWTTDKNDVTCTHCLTAIKHNCAPRSEESIARFNEWRNQHRDINAQRFAEPERMATIRCRGASVMHSCERHAPVGSSWCTACIITVEPCEHVIHYQPALLIGIHDTAFIAKHWTSNTELVNCRQCRKYIVVPNGVEHLKNVA